MRYAVRSHTYRDQPGFLVLEVREKGDHPGGWPQRIFTRTRASAEVIRERMRNGEEVTLADFAITDTQEVTA